MDANLLEAKTEDQKHFITTSISNLMHKLYDPQRTGIIGPRFWSMLYEMPWQPL